MDIFEGLISLFDRDYSLAKRKPESPFCFLKKGYKINFLWPKNKKAMGFESPMARNPNKSNEIQAHGCMVL
jgi:hypothetical protein